MEVSSTSKRIFIIDDRDKDRKKEKKQFFRNPLLDNPKAMRRIKSVFGKTLNYAPCPKSKNKLSLPKSMKEEIANLSKDEKDFLFERLKLLCSKIFFDHLHKILELNPLLELELHLKNGKVRLHNKIFKPENFGETLKVCSNAAFPLDRVRVVATEVIGRRLDVLGYHKAEETIVGIRNIVYPEEDKKKTLSKKSTEAEKES